VRFKVNLKILKNFEKILKNKKKQIKFM